MTGNMTQTENTTLANPVGWWQESVIKLN
jgi:hypothetical protein